MRPTLLELGQLRLRCALLAILSLTFCRPIIAQTAAAPTPELQVLFDRRYAETDSAIALLKILAQSVPTTVLRAPHSAETISQLVVNVYRFGPTQRPRSYEVLYERIRALNNLTADGDLPNRDLLVPTLPSWSPPLGYSRAEPTRGFRRDLPKNKAPIFVTGMIARAEAVPVAAAVSDTVLSDDWIDAFHQDGGAFLGVLRIPTTDTATINAIPLDRRLVLAPLEVTASDVAVTGLHDDDTSFALNATAAQAIAAASKRKRSPVPLYVLDLEWPDHDAAALSIPRIYDLLNIVRRADAAHELRPRSVPSTLATSRFPHSAAIRSSLAALTSLDSNEAVPIVWLPMAAEPFADSVLVDVLATYLYHRYDAAFGTSPDEATARRQAVEIVKRIPTTIRDEARTLSTSRVVLDAVVELLDFASKSTGTPYVLNASWVSASPVSLRPPTTSPSSGIIVAAAGNFDEDMSRSNRDLSKWSADGREVLSVENYDRAHALTCHSSFFPSASTAVAADWVVAFPGGRTPTTPYPCGTSFSAPRVAWSIALWLSARAPIANWAGWYDGVWRQVATASPADPHDQSAHEFSIERLLNSPSPF